MNDAAKVYEVVKTNLLKLPKSTIEAEKDIEISGIAGKEFDVLQDYDFQKVRILIVGRRIYEIKSDVTNWHILTKSYPGKVADFKSETERFFASFKPLKFPEIVVVPIPDDFLGTATDSAYKNTFFYFSLSFPQDWEKLNKSEIEGFKSIGLESLKTEKEKTNKAFEEAASKEVVIFLITPKKDILKKGSSFGIGVLKQPNSQITPEKVAIATKNFFLTNPNFNLLEDIQNLNIGGAQFSTFTLSNKDSVKQKLLITVRQGFSVTFVMSYFNSEGQSDLEKIVKSLKFDAK